MRYQEFRHPERPSHRRVFFSGDAGREGPCVYERSSWALRPTGRDAKDLRNISITTAFHKHLTTSPSHAISRL